MPKTFKFTDNSDVVSRLFGIAVNKTLGEIGDLVAGEANRRAPVGETGELSASYDHKEDLVKKSTTVGSPLNYAPYVELGTGPHYEKPPEWVKNYAQRGHHDTDPWWYMGDDGEWHLGWFIHAQPHLRPAVEENVDKIKKIVKDNLNNA